MPTNHILSDADSKISELHRRLDDHLRQEAEEAANFAVVVRDLESLRETVKAMEKTLSEIELIMTKIGGAMAFVKVMAGITAAGAAAWAWIAGHIQFTSGKM